MYTKKVFKIKNLIEVAIAISICFKKVVKLEAKKGAIAEA